MADGDFRMEEALLARAAASVAYPATPALRARMEARIVAGQARATRERPRFAFAAAAAGMAAVALIAATLAVPASRDAVADFFGIEGSEVHPLPTPAPGTTATPLAEPESIERIATRTTLAEAALETGFEPAMPGGEGEPLAVYLLSYDRGAVVAVLQYAEFDLWESRFDSGAFSKGAPPEASIQELQLQNGAFARWIAGGRHIVEFLDSAGTPVAGSQRTVDRNTLIWRTDYAFYRLETDLPFDTTVSIAESLR